MSCFLLLFVSCILAGPFTNYLRARLRGAANNLVHVQVRSKQVLIVFFKKKLFTQSHPWYVVRNYQNEARNGGKGQL